MFLGTVSSDAVVDYLERSTSFLTPSKRRKLDVSPPASATTDDNSVQTGSTDPPVTTDPDPRCKRHPGRLGLKNGGTGVKSFGARATVGGDGGEEAGSQGSKVAPGRRGEGRGAPSAGAESAATASSGAGSDTEAGEKRTCGTAFTFMAFTFNSE